MEDTVLILDNIRSAHNVGAIMRTAAGFGVKQIYVLGKSPYPKLKRDPRLPHIAERANRQIRKTALGAENVVTVTPIKDELMLIKELRGQGYELVAIENDPKAKPLPSYRPANQKTALIFGHEIEGVSQNLLNSAHVVLAIPMSRHKESFNVAAAAAMAMYYFRFKA